MKVKMDKLNLGCGEDIREGYLNVDLYNKNADLSIDLNKMPYPFNKNSFSEIVALNILEHLDKPFEVLLEWHRISKPNARIEIKVPHFSSGNAWADIQHKRPFSLKTFRNPNLQKYFKVERCFVGKYWAWFGNHFPRLWEYGLAFILPSGDLTAVLRVIKEYQK